MSANQMNDKLGTMPIGRLLPSMAIPMMLSFFIQALYSFVDSIFVARVSENALAAVSLSYPVQNIICAIAVGIGIGMSVSSAKANGEGNYDKANKLLNTGMTILAIFCLIIMIFGTFFVRKFFEFQTDVTEIVEGGIIYLQICCLLCQGMVFAIYLEKALVCVGYSLYSMLALAVGSIINIILDPILIFGLGPFDAMGIKGAAIATVIGQYSEFAIAIGLFLWKNKVTRLNFNQMAHISRKDVGQILRIGFPSMINIGLSSIASFFINQILLTYSTTATAAYGIWMKLQNFCYMPGYGLNNGMIPILSYNKGKGYYDRIRKTIRYAVSFNVALMIVTSIVLVFIPVPILKLFNATPNMMDIGVKMLKICLLSLPFGGFCIVIGSSMQSLGGEVYTTILNFSRGLVIIVPAFLVVHLIFHDLNMVWWAVLLAELVSFVVGALCYARVHQRMPEDSVK